MKFTYDTNQEAKSNHWDYCEKNHYPYITVRKKNQLFFEIFFDVTNLKVDLFYISETVKKVFLSYCDFFLISANDFVDYDEQYYFFTFPVKMGHEEFVANQLFDFLLNEIIND